MTRRAVCLLVACSLPLVAVCLLLFVLPRRPQVGPDWTPERLRDELGKAGLVYDAAPLGGDSLLLKKAGVNLSWDEVRLEINGTARGRRIPLGVLEIDPFNPDHRRPEPEEDRLVFPSLIVRGHPDELKAVADVVGR